MLVVMGVTCQLSVTCFVGTYIPKKEVVVLETIKATVIRENQAIRLRARKEGVDRGGVRRVTGEEHCRDEGPHGVQICSRNDEICRQTSEQCVFVKMCHAMITNQHRDLLVPYWWRLIRKPGSSLFLIREEPKMHNANNSRNVLNKEKNTLWNL